MSAQTEAETASTGEGDTTMGMLVHGIALIGFVIPLGNLIGPALIWVLKKDEDPFVDENGKNALNFQITWTIILFLAGLSLFVLVGFVLLPVAALIWLVLVILAALEANGGEVANYELGGYPTKIDLL